MSLDEQALQRLMEGTEDGALEFKKGTLSRNEIAEYAVGLGNEGGGWLLLGITDKKPRRVVGINPLSDPELQKIRDAVMDTAGIRVEVEQLATASGTVLAVHIPGRPRGHVFSTKTGKYLMRSGEALRGMTLTEIDRIRTSELRYRDVLAETVPGDWFALVDAVEIERLRGLLADHGRSELASLPDQNLLVSLEVLTPEDGGCCLTRAGVLLVGKREAIKALVPLHEVKLQRYDRDDLTPSFNEDSRKTLLAIMQRTWELVELVNQEEPVQSGMLRIDIERFPKAAYREAIANALIHRDYEQPGNVALRIYRDRLEIGNPGGWFGGVNEHNILVTESQRRNELLAAVFQRIGLVERSAVGVKRMYEAMLRNGKLPPTFRSTAGSIVVTLLNGTYDRQFITLTRRCAEQGIVLSVFHLLILAHVRRHREIALADVSRLCQQPPEHAPRLLDDLRNWELLDRQGQGKARRWVFGARAYEWLGLTGERPRDLGMSEQRLVGLLLDELERRREKGITNREVQEWSHFSRAHVTRILADLVNRGLVMFSGKRGMGARYWLPHYAPALPRDNA